ncbi:hypothetical protein [Nocardia brasiliensis]|uniref:hypothetical protein n=1 Tax=Nocardia brasiliensis TaxID=37326 RepID=UPI0024548A05|nr:hypothetical protein [Nocardia brasiliensis]
MRAVPLTIYGYGTDPRATFQRLTRHQAIEIEAAHAKELDHHFHSSDPSPAPVFDYGATIAAKLDSELIVLADTPMPRTAAEQLADRIRAIHPRISDPRGPVGAIAVRGDTLYREIDIDLSPYTTGTDAEPVDPHDRAWQLQTLHTVMNNRYPGETVNDIYSDAIDIDDHGRQRLNLFVRTTGAPDQHTGWLYVAVVPATAP